MMAKNTEIELKLLVDKHNLKKLLSLDFVAAAIRPDSCQKRRLVSSYYDTQDMAFMRQGIAYRVRDKGDGTSEATVKTSIKNSAGLSERLELNLPLARKRPVLAGFAELGLGYELSELAPSGINKLFTVTVQRTTYILDLDGAAAELAIDHGKIAAGRETDKIDEIEIELLEGDKGVLLNFAAQIAAQVPLFVEKRSKFVRGLALCGIQSELPLAKSKLGSALVKQEVLTAIARHGDILLDLQQKLQAGLDKKTLKALRRELVTLRSTAALIAINADECEFWPEIFAAVDTMRNLQGIQLLWERLNQAGKEILGRTSLQKKLDSALQNEENILQEHAAQGHFTAIVYSLTDKAYHAADSEIAAEDAARAMLKKWQQQENNIAALENICALARCCTGKYFAKAAEAAKKQRRQLNQQAWRANWSKLLQDICADSSSKIVYRDMGVLLGYLLAKF